MTEFGWVRRVSSLMLFGRCGLIHQLPPGRHRVPDAVAQIDDDADHRPDAETDPRVARQEHHHEKAHGNAGWPDEPDEGRTERTLHVRTADAQHHDADADDD